MMRMATHAVTSNVPVVCAATMINAHDWLINNIGGQRVNWTKAPYQLNALYCSCLYTIDRFVDIFSTN